MRIRYTLLMLAFVVLLGSTFNPARASPEKDREVDLLREQIHSLLRQADELRAAGKHDAAREKVQKAEQIERRLAEHFAKEQRKDYSDAELKKILTGLEHGIGSLKALGKNDLAEALYRVAKDVRGKREAPHEEPVNRERKAAKRQIEIMRMAMKAFLETDHHDAAERVEYAIHSFELALAGRRDKEASQIREKAPNRAELAKLMAWAGKIYRESRMPERAEKVEELGRLFAGQAERRKPRPERTEHSEAEQKQTRHILEVLGIAKHGLMEVERRDLAEKVEHLMHAIELSREGRRDEEALKIIKSAPRGENMVEILSFAANKWEGFGHEKKAAAIRKLVREWHGGQRNEPGRHQAGESAPRDRKVAELQAQLAEIAEMMRHLQKELEAMKREMK